MKWLRNINFTDPRSVIFVTFISVVWVNFNLSLWQNRRVIQHDVAFYYSYLPSAFIYKDIRLDLLKETSNHELLERFNYPNRIENGNYVFKSTMGMALTYLPFFGLAHIYANLFDYPLDGYSEPYQFGVLFSSLIYFLIGLIFLVRTLRVFMTDQVITPLLFLLVFGTNVFYYLTVGAGMSHIANFALASVFIYYCVKWHYEQRLKSIVILSLAGALLTLIRPINILYYIFFFLYNVKNLTQGKEKLLLLKKKYSHMLIMASVGVLIFLPQCLYWRMQTGSFFFNSYVDEHFFFDHPQILNGLFSFRKGWLIYTPLMAFALIGFFSLYKNQKNIFLSVMLTVVIYLYTAFSWWCWWYGGSFGQRALIDIYPLMAFPLGQLLLSVNKISGIKKFGLYAILGLLVILNLFQSMQAKYNIIHYDSMTKEAYLDAFFRTSKDANRERLLKHPDIEKAKAGLNEY